MTNLTLYTSHLPIHRYLIKSQIHRFPHLWTFLGSATTYSDIILALMDQFNWGRVGLVYNSGSVYSSELARYFEQDLKLKGKTLVFSEEIRGKSKIYMIEQSPALSH